MNPSVDPDVWPTYASLRRLPTRREVAAPVFPVPPDGASPQARAARDFLDVDNSDHRFLLFKVVRTAHSPFGSSFGKRWTGSEQAEQFQPILIDGTVAAGGLDEVYAVNLLGRYRPDFDRSPLLKTGDEIQRNPLTGDEWRAAFAIFRDVIAPSRIAGSQRLNAVIDGMLARLINGELRAYARSIRGTGELSPIPPDRWTSDLVLGRFLFGLFNHHSRLERATIKLSPQWIKTSLLWPKAEWPEFVFLDAEAVTSNVLPLNAEADASAVNGPAKARDRLDDGLIEGLEEWRHRVSSPRLVNIDVLEARRSAGDDYAALKPLQQWAKRNRIAVLPLYRDPDGSTAIADAMCPIASSCCPYMRGAE